jgi:hypothetical protein
MKYPTQTRPGRSTRAWHFLLCAAGKETPAPFRITIIAHDVSRCSASNSCEDTTDRITRSDDAYVVITLRVTSCAVVFLLVLNIFLNADTWDGLTEKAA